MERRSLEVLLVDDEPLARAALRSLLERTPDVEVVGECGDGKAALQALRDHAPDVLLLDIQMPRMDGFELIKHLESAPPPLVIFITAYDHYAVRAFRALALDYLLKPCSEKDLKQALDRAREHLASAHLSDIGRRMLHLMSELGLEEAEAEGEVQSSESGYLQRFTVRKRTRTVLIDVADIEWIEADDYCVRLHMSEAQHTLRRSLKWFGERLDPSHFLRVHRSAVINLNHLTEIQHLAADDHLAILRSGSRVPLSRAGRDTLAKLFESL